MLSRILYFIALILPIESIAMINKDGQNSEYILATGQAGASNLDLQHETFKEESFLKLKEAGLTEKMVVWDVGCGSGTMTEYLANKVGNDGLVYAIDSSEAQIEVAKKRVEAAGYKNVKFIVSDINNIDSTQYKKADIVYSRLLLMHVHNPEKAIGIMASLLKPHGILSLQESSFDTVAKNNTNHSLKKYSDLIIAYGKLKGFDYNIGRKLPSICDKLNIFSKVNYSTKIYSTTDKMKALLSERYDELGPKFISANLITKEDYSKLKIDLHNYLKDKKSNESPVLAEQSYIVAYK